MKHVALVSIILVLLALSIGLIFKLGFKDNKIISIQSIDDIVGLNCNINQIFSDEDEFGVFQDDYISKIADELDKASSILIVRPTGYIRQYNYTSLQQVEVIEVIRGSASAGDIIELTGTGVFSVYDQKYAAMDYDNDNPIYSGFVNCMMNRHEYLVFVEDLSLNKISNVKKYWVESPFFTVLDLTSDYSIPVNKPVNELKYNDFAESEFFCQSEKMLNRLLEIKYYILNRYAENYVK